METGFMETIGSSQKGKYVVYSDGSIWSDFSGRFLKNFLRNGYPSVRINGRHEYVHRLVANAYLGDCPKGMEVCHNDSNKLNNCVENLRYDTRTMNNRDNVKAGNHNNVKLSEQDRMDIRWLCSMGVVQLEIAKWYNVTPACVSRVKYQAM